MVAYTKLERRLRQQLLELRQFLAFLLGQRQTRAFTVEQHLVYQSLLLCRQCCIRGVNVLLRGSLGVLDGTFADTWSCRSADCMKKVQKSTYDVDPGS